MSARTGRFILRLMILLAALTWLAALALAEPQATRQGAQRGNTDVAAVAAQAQAQKAAQVSPFAGPEDARLTTWTGVWEESVRFAGDAEDKPGGSGRWRAAPFYGLYVVINYESKAPQGNYHAHGVMAYDHEAKSYRLWWFDDGANISEYTGTWKDDATLVFESKRTNGGKTFRERITYSKPSDDEIQTKIEQAFGAEPFKVYSQAEAHRMTDAQGQGNQNQQRPGKRPGT